MEPEVSLPCSQQAAIGPCSDPRALSPHLPTLFPKIHSNIIPSTPTSSKWPHSFKFSDQNFVHITPVSCVCYMPCLSRPWFIKHYLDNLGPSQRIIRYYLVVWLQRRMIVWTLCMLWRRIFSHQVVWLSSSNRRLMSCRHSAELWSG